MFIDKVTVFSLIGWYYLPRLLTSIAQSTFYQLSAGYRKTPAKDSAQYHHEAKIFRVLVILSYLAYDIFKSYRAIVDDPDIGPNYYTQLNITPASTTSEIRKVYRQLSMIHHPDKLGSQDRWIEIQNMYKVLSSQVLQFGYDRFGPRALEWASYAPDKQLVTTTTDLVMKGLRYSVIPHYLFSAFSMIGLGWVGVKNYGDYWKYWILLCGFAIELSLITHEGTTGLLLLLPFEKIALLRKITLALFAAMNQLWSILQLEPQNDDKINHSNLSQLTSTAVNINQLASINMQMVSQPYSGKDINFLKKVCGERKVENRVMNSTIMQNAINKKTKQE